MEHRPPFAEACERVLVVNDNPDMLATMRDVLEVGGAKAVRTAASQDEAEQVLRSGFEPSVILLDVRLGKGERGDDYARRLRADPRFFDTPIVLVSGDVHELHRLEGGADGTLSKPFDIEHLYELLTDVCSGSR